MKRTLAERRGFAVKKKEYIYRKILRTMDWREGGVILPEFVGVLARTPCRCSCWTCGHRRKYVGPTRQERIKERPIPVYNHFSFYEACR